MNPKLNIKAYMRIASVQNVFYGWKKIHQAGKPAASKPFFRVNHNVSSNDWCHMGLIAWMRLNKIFASFVFWLKISHWIHFHFHFHFGCIYIALKLFEPSTQNMLILIFTYTLAFVYLHSSLHPIQVQPSQVKSSHKCLILRYITKLRAVDYEKSLNKYT